MLLSSIFFNATLQVFATRAPLTQVTPMDERVIRVLIADDHSIVRDGLRALVTTQPGLVVIGEASSGLEAWRRSCDLLPDVTVLDLSMPNVSGVEAAERIAQDCPSVKVLVLTMHEERGYVSRVFRTGAAGYALKRSAAAELVRAIRTVAAGEHYVDPSLAGALLASRTHNASHADGAQESRASTLTTRETEVLRFLALGYSNKEIAASLAISVKTVETHRASGMARLGVTSRAALVRFAITEGWLQNG